MITILHELPLFRNVFDMTLLNFEEAPKCEFLIIIFKAFSADSKQHNFMQKCYFRSDKNSATI